MSKQEIIDALKMLIGIAIFSAFVWHGSQLKESEHVRVSAMLRVCHSVDPYPNHTGYCGGFDDGFAYAVYSATFNQ